MPKTYLCGVIQDAKDSGVKWRNTLTPKLEALGITVLDPCKSVANLSEGTIIVAKETMAGWLASGHREKFLCHMRRVRETDIDMLRDADFLIVYLDWNQRFGGTIAEMWDSFVRYIPLYVVCYDPLKDWNHWLLSMVWDGGEMFDNFSQLLDFLEKKYAKRDS